MPQVYIAIGSNIEPEQRMRQVATLLRARFPGIRFSRCYRNPAVGFDGEDFFNAVAGFECEEAAATLVDALHAIEEQCGRKRDDPKWAPRAMDLDVLLYGDAVSSTPVLRVPRADLLRRAYMLLPLAELAPALMHPVAQRSMAELAAELQPHAPALQAVDLDL